jgi:type II secretory pathway component PulL
LKTIQRLHRGLAADISWGMYAVSNLLAAARAEEGRPRRAWRILRTVALTVAVVGVVFRLGAPAHAQKLTVQLWGLLNEKCKDGLPDDPKTAQACAKREQYSAKLQRYGCVYHEDGGWWKCPH